MELIIVVAIIGILATIALPAKVLFFILIDGWNLLVGSLVRSYG